MYHNLGTLYKMKSVYRHLENLKSKTVFVEALKLKVLDHRWSCRLPQIDLEVREAVQHIHGLGAVHAEGVSLHSTHSHHVDHRDPWITCSSNNTPPLWSDRTPCKHSWHSSLFQLGDASLAFHKAVWEEMLRAHFCVCVYLKITTRIPSDVYYPLST